MSLRGAQRRSNLGGHEHYCRRSDRLSARLDPVRAAADAAGRARRHPPRSAPAISAPPTCCAPATRRWPRVTLVFDVGKGVAAVLIGGAVGHGGGARRVGRGGARTHVPGLAAAFAAARGWPRRSACCSRWPGRSASIAALLWLATALISHYSSLAALVAAVAVAGDRLALCRPAARDRVRRSSRSWSCCGIAATSSGCWPAPKAGSRSGKGDRPWPRATSTRRNAWTGCASAAPRASAR